MTELGMPSSFKSSPLVRIKHATNAGSLEGECGRNQAVLRILLLLLLLLLLLAGIALALCAHLKAVLKNDVRLPSCGSISRQRQ